MNNFGGKRSGAGRPKGSKNRKTIIEAKAREFLVQQVLAKWDSIISTMLSVGLGKAKYIIIKNGKEITYIKAPNPQVLLDLISFVIGKPKIEFSGAINTPQLDELTKNVRAILEKK